MTPVCPSHQLRLARIVRGVALLLSLHPPVTFRLEEDGEAVNVAWLLEKLSYKLEEPPVRLIPSVPVEDDLEDYI
jgi:hypothetical protein